MTTELAKVYDPKAIEAGINEKWTDSGAFDADPQAGRDAYCIVIPPPNVTAPLHLGHALNNTLQDILIRFKRMQQLNTLWMPGTDHAGIATQTVVEKRILAEQGKRRTDFQRDQFVARIQAWKDQYEARILSQLQLMGCSCDWRRTRFTMDEFCARAVRETFFKLFADGLIYRGKRLVNWDPATQTVLADDEVEHETIQGHFWYMRYPLVEPVEFGGERIKHVTVATTRPETMLGDTAVAMHPSDPRAKALVGKTVRLPIVGRKIPIIESELVVLPDADSEDEKARFSTGFLKVTPAHDPTDWEIGQRNDLPVINVMAPDGTISDKHGWADAESPEAQQLLGMDRFEAREAVVEWFRTEKLLEDVREYVHEVGHSYRSHVPIEPYLSDQWYIAVKEQIPSLPDEGLIEGTHIPANSLAGLALKPLLDGRVKFTPDRYANTYRSWLENLRDWPISRQLWWGHRIPIWFFTPEVPVASNPFPAVSSEDEQYLDELRARLRAYARTMRLPDDSFALLSNKDSWQFFICSRSLRADNAVEAMSALKGEFSAHEVTPGMETPAKLMSPFPSPQAKVAAFAVIEMILELKQDEDVLDTWFSSALWPFSTLKWPEDSPDLETFYPGDVLCTAREIITLWVSRMVMLGQYCVGDIPFTDVFIHAMIQDGEGRKMSKSLGNGIDPLDIIDSHGADAMRFTLAAMTTQTQDVRMPVEEIELPDGRKANTSRKFDMGRNFCNKLWNASRFALMNISGAPGWDKIDPAKELSDKWILTRLSETIRSATEAIEAFQFNDLADGLYHFMWDDFCDWYLEIAKIRINSGDESAKAVLAHCLDVLLRLLHPICPFITEEIWSRLNEVAPARGPSASQAEEMLASAHWPGADAALQDRQAESDFELYQEAVRSVRNIRTEHNIKPSQKLDVEFRDTEGKRVAQVLEMDAEIFSAQTASNIVLPASVVGDAKSAATFTVEGASFTIPGVIDTQAEKARLDKQAATLRKGIKGIEAKLGNESFLTKAPPELVERERERLGQLKRDLQAVDKSLEALR